MGIYEDIQKSIKRQEAVAESFFVHSNTPDLIKNIETDIEKGGKAAIGETRIWNGKKMRKQPNGKWVEVSEKGMSKREHIDESLKIGRNADYATSVNERRRISERISPSIKLHNELASKLSGKEYDDSELEEPKKKPSKEVKGDTEVDEASWLKKHGGSKDYSGKGLMGSEQQRSSMVVINFPSEEAYNKAKGDFKNLPKEIQNNLSSFDSIKNRIILHK